MHPDRGVEPAFASPSGPSTPLAGVGGPALWGPALLGALLSACAGAPTREPSYSLPAWIDRPPVEEAYLYAVGTYWGSLNPSDDEKNAIGDATTKLAHAIRTQVKSLQAVRSDDGSVSAQGTTILTAEGQVQNAQHVETWRDLDGRRGRKGAVWVLLRVERPR